jgi:hypothetical protein
MLQFLLTQIGKIKTAVSSLNSKLTVETVSTGIQSVYLQKMGNLVLVFFVDKSIPTFSANGWQTLFTLPEEYRPSNPTEFTSCISASTAEALESRVNTNGDVNVYAFSGMSGKPVCGQVVFFI